MRSTTLAPDVLEILAPHRWRRIEHKQEWVHIILILQESEEMPRGDKSTYTEKQKRQAEHIEEGYEQRGVSEAEQLS